MASVNGLRQDLRLIADLVAPNTRVLDVGCDDGALLAFLARTKQVDARGIELSQAGVHDCVSRGLAVSRATPTPTLRSIRTTPSTT
jgi:methionine biosynthesis protein MetW